MPKKTISLSVRHPLRLGLKPVISISALLSFLALVRLNSQSKLQPSVSPSRISDTLNDNFEGFPKIAFLFLVHENLPLDFLWHSFFKNAEVEKFSIYLHSKPGFVFDESTTRSAFFYGRQLRNSVQVAWGESSMIEAERLLLEAALDDPANQRFVLLSDSCIPLYNFSYINNYLMSSRKSFVDSFLDVKEFRYNPMMSPVIPKHKWRKGSQWITLVKRLAEVVVDDEIVFPVFKKFCKRRRRPLSDLSKEIGYLKLQFHHNCIPDEHYVQTLLTMKGLEDELERRTLTYCLWNQSAGRRDTNRWHPVTFNHANNSHEQIKKIKDINYVYYESEHQNEWCRANSILAPCFLFARKFSRGAAMRLLTDGMVGPYDATALPDALT